MNTKMMDASKNAQLMQALRENHPKHEEKIREMNQQRDKTNQGFDFSR